MNCLLSKGCFKVWIRCLINIFQKSFFKSHWKYLQVYNFEFHLDHFYIGVLRQGFWRFLKIYFPQCLYLFYWRSVSPRNSMQFLQSLMVYHLTQLLFSDLRLTGALSGLKLFLDPQEKSGSWDFGQNAVSQSDCRIFKLTISLEQNDKKDFFCIVIQIHGN